jgi:hypothetical protein
MIEIILVFNKVKEVKEKNLSPIKEKNALNILNFSYHLSYHQIQTIRKSQYQVVFLGQTQQPTSSTSEHNKFGI